MIKRILPLVIFLLFNHSLVGSAASNISSWGIAQDKLMFHTSNDAYYIPISSQIADTQKHTRNGIKGADMSIKSSTTAIYYACLGDWDITYYKNGQEVGGLKFTATRIQNESSSCDGGGGDNGGGNDGGNSGGDGGCSTCDIMNCPGWSDYMGKLDDIKNAIPPAPNWGSVADTFRDSIAPKIKSDLSDLLGKAPNAPSAPGKPNAPKMPTGLDDGGIKAPTGKDVPSFDFNENDIKNESEKIPEREDPTGGGFDILDPIEGLPSQDEFKDNIPNEGEVAIPKPPEELENIAPKPDEVENVAPKPEESENVAPKPDEGSNVAPTPSEQENVAPKPNEGSNIAPTPGEGEDSKIPIPGKQEDDKIPIPDGGNNGYPFPGEIGGSAPIPNESGKAPIPKNDTNKAPIPKGG